MIGSDSEVANRPFSGFYLGEVVWHSSSGIIKVFIPGVYPDEWKQQPQMLPDCLQMTPLFGGSNKGNGIFSYPNYGTIVICYLQNNDQNYPVALGALLGGSSTGNSLAGDEYKKCQAEPSTANLSAGTDAFVHTIKAGRSHVSIYENGNVDIEVHDKDQLSGRNISLVSINGDGTINLSSSVKVSIVSPEINISANTMLNIESPQITMNSLGGIINLSSDAYSNVAIKQIRNRSKFIQLDASEGSYEFDSATKSKIFRD